MPQTYSFWLGFRDCLLETIGVSARLCGSLSARSEQADACVCFFYAIFPVQWKKTDSPEGISWPLGRISFNTSGPRDLSQSTDRLINFFNDHKLLTVSALTDRRE